ncbi:MAG TPA: urease accessory protein UreD [Stellaceae bacterium]|nr:urease accessory protein UreD [Stellaceae bacterium]
MDSLESPHLQRARGAARVGFRRRGEQTVLAELYQQTPCRVLFPDPAAGDPVQAVLVTTSGGLTGGDRIGVAITAGPGTTATATTQAAEKIYRSTGDDCRIDVEIDIAAGAWLEWLPQETILFDRSRLKRRTEVRIEAEGALLAVEIVLFGRVASGETLRQGRLYDGWAIRRGGRLAWADAVALEGDIAALRDAAFGFGAACGYATVMSVGRDAESQVEAMRETLAGTTDQVGVTAINGVLLIRLLDVNAARLRAAAERAVCILRERLAGLPPRLPRVWHV